MRMRQAVSYTNRDTLGLGSGHRTRVSAGTQCLTNNDRLGQVSRCTRSGFYLIRFYSPRRVSWRRRWSILFAGTHQRRSYRLGSARRLSDALFVSFAQSYSRVYAQQFPGKVDTRSRVVYEWYSSGIRVVNEACRVCIYTTVPARVRFSDAIVRENTRFTRSGRILRSAVGNHPPPPIARGKNRSCISLERRRPRFWERIEFR